MPTKAKKENPPDVALLSNEEIACAHLCLEFDEVYAATELCWSIQQVRETLAMPHVRLYLADYHAELLKQIAQKKVRKMQKTGVTKGAVEERLMQLMNMDPTDTKGSIEGQVRAGKVLADILGLTSGGSDNDLLKDKTADELRAIVENVSNRLQAAPPKTVN